VLGSPDMAAGPPKKNLRWGRLIFVFLVLGGLIAGAVVLVAR
jgi:hypothetical protein